jgi:4-carboxymuconolactone decarboxylase
MATLPQHPEPLPPAAQRAYERIQARRASLHGRGRPSGPFAPLLHHPALAERVGELGEFLRFDGRLPGDVRELAILVAARAVSQPYEWIAHEPIARKEGLPEEVIERIRARQDLAALPARYAAAARVVDHAVRPASVPDDLAAAVTRDLGVEGLVELVVLGGYYRMIAGVLFAFDAPLPDGAVRPF